MRLFPWLRRYQCQKCHKFKLASHRKIDNARALEASQRAGR
ncbi:hypothetical protein ACSFBX_09135 [Variovorax sp. RB2P76]|jgi:hypothetical protein